MLRHLLSEALILALAPAALASTTWYVDGIKGSDTNDCRSPQTACKTIGHAISLASSGDSVLIARGRYKENLTVGTSLRIVGSGLYSTIIDGGAINTVVTIPNSATQVSLSRLSITNGHAIDGAGIYNAGTLAMFNSSISSNTSTGCHFGATCHGGGIYNSGNVTIKRSTVAANVIDVEGVGGAFGAGMYSKGAVTIHKSTFSGNRTSGQPLRAEGGAILNDGGTLTINNSTFSGNVASGILGQNWSGGGGISSEGDGSLIISSSTFSGNRGYYGGGLFVNGGMATLQNTIIANSQLGGNCLASALSNGYNLSSDDTCNFSGPGDLNNTDPILEPLQNNGGPTQTMALHRGSPAIDAGNPNGCMGGEGYLLKTDQRGSPRPDKEDNGGCDIGAFERQKE